LKNIDNKSKKFNSRFDMKIKKFDEWSLLKPKINEKNKLATFKQRDVFWVYIGENIGSEEDGKGDEFLRPVVILKVFNKEFCFVVPLSTKIKENRYCVGFEFNNKKQSALISQIKSIDARRLHFKIGTLSRDDYNLVMSAIIDFLQK
jgi:mRNA interferase MazF